MLFYDHHLILIKVDIKPQVYMLELCLVPFDLITNEQDD